jgi:Meiotically up-regulated gene 113
MHGAAAGAEGESMTALVKCDQARAALAECIRVVNAQRFVSNNEDYPMYLRTELVSAAEFWKAFHERGAVYFIRDKGADTIKIGYSADPWKRLSNLQVGNSSRLELIGVVAAERAIEGIVHFQLIEGAIDGEWFWDRGVTTEWLMNMTSGEPMCRNVWTLVDARQWLSIWHKDNRTHSKHYWNKDRKEWEPPLPKV